MPIRDVNERSAQTCRGPLRLYPTGEGRVTEEVSQYRGKRLHASEAAVRLSRLFHFARRFTA